jgi:subtilisin family serine protease
VKLNICFHKLKIKKIILILITVFINWIGGAFFTPIWAANAVVSPSAELGTEPSTITIALIDTGITPFAYGTSSALFLPAKNMVSHELSLDDSQQQKASSLVSDCVKAPQGLQHGTDIANLMVAMLDEENTASPMRHSILIQSIRVHNGCGIKRLDLLNSLAWAGGLSAHNGINNPHPAKIINLSLSSDKNRCGEDLQKIINALAAKNIFIVAAAGNTFHKAPKEPANCRGVISVGATDVDNKISAYSALDPMIGLYAFGGEGEGRAPALVTPTNDHFSSQDLATNHANQVTYGPHDRRPSVQDLMRKNKGTSFAAPVVTSYLTQWLSTNPQKTLADFVEEIERITVLLPPLAECPRCTPRLLPLSEMLKTLPSDFPNRHNWNPTKN